MFTEHYLEWTNEVVHILINYVNTHNYSNSTNAVSWLRKSTSSIMDSTRKAMKQSKIQKWVIENYSHLNDDEVEIFISTKTKEDFVNLFEEHGMNKKQIKELMKKINVQVSILW